VRGIGYVPKDGELYEEGGAEPPDEYTETLSSQSLEAPLDCAEEVEEEVELLLANANSLGSFLTRAPSLDLGLTVPLLCLRALFPARSSSKRSGLGRR
jgi:hypothetical protein